MEIADGRLLEVRDVDTQKLHLYGSTTDLFPDDNSAKEVTCTGRT